MLQKKSKKEGDKKKSDKKRRGSTRGGDLDYDRETSKPINHFFKQERATQTMNRYSKVKYFQPFLCAEMSKVKVECT